MSEHKNQHYVPRCLLKPFTLDGDGKAINLYNLRAEKFIQNAPVKSQCSRNFFYGVDLGPEEALAEIEGEYARIVDLIRADNELKSDDVEWLRFFAIVQTRRTARAVAQMEQFNQLVAEATFKRHPDQRPADLSHDELVLMSMGIGLGFAKRIDDLKLIILANRTDTEFSVSDHPSVISNRYSFEVLNLAEFGMASSGLFLVLPISPDRAAFFFDIGAYTVSIPRGTRLVNIRNSSDVEALNELQQLNAEENIYFSSWPAREKFVIRDRRLDQQRALAPRIRTLVQDSIPGAFRTGTEEEEAASRRSLVQASSQHPRPRSWPIFLKIRKKPIIYSNGSAAGFVRKEEWLLPGALDGI